MTQELPRFTANALTGAIAAINQHGGGYMFTINIYQTKFDIQARKHPGQSSSVQYCDAQFMAPQELDAGYKTVCKAITEIQCRAGKLGC